ncbi:hypothetical protein Mgra_00010191, partial [Meloidogyne graminicola]
IFIHQVYQYNQPNINENLIKKYPCHEKEDWCKNREGYTNNYKCSANSDEMEKGPALYPMCHDSLNQYEFSIEVCCRAVHACLSHLIGIKGLAKIETIKANRDKYKYLKMSDCYGAIFTGVVKIHHDSKENKDIYYAVSTNQYGHFSWINCHADCAYVTRPYAIRQITLNKPCPHCNLWCAYSGDYTCHYTCAKERAWVQAKYDKTKYYPLCDQNFKGFEEDTHECCSRLEECYKTKGEFSWKPIKLNECFHDFHGEALLTNVATTTRAQAWSCSSIDTEKNGCRDFYDWCGLKCVGHRLKPLATWELEDKDHLNFREKLKNEAWKTDTTIYCDSNYGLGDNFLLGGYKKINNFVTFGYANSYCEDFMEESDKCKKTLKYEFNCGSSGDGTGFTHTERLGCIQAMNNCPRHMIEEIAICCTIHDKCYDEQKGQAFCDEKFCVCLREASYGNSDCRVYVAVAFCETVKITGMVTY